MTGNQSCQIIDSYVRMHLTVNQLITVALHIHDAVKFIQKFYFISYGQRLVFTPPQQSKGFTIVTGAMTDVSCQ